MRMYDIINKKKEGGTFTREEIEYFVSGYTCGDIPDYQMSALCMAVYFKGMTDEETACLTDSMARSGDMIDLSMFGNLSVDKHSTGGVGDKTTLIVAPIVAALGGKVAKMSGRGLGHTGGTVDKLESIDGYKTSIPVEEFLRQVDKVGVAVIGQTGNLAPADKKIYALRDVTATVDSIPLIASSIMSKKLAAGAHSIVLDVKTGSGAFMKSIDDAERLARAMVDIGETCGRNVSALITNMDIPLGRAIGNSLEVKEAVAVLKGEQSGDLREICTQLAANMLSLCHGWTIEDSEQRVTEVINSGKAFEKFKEWVAAQGGNTKWIDDLSLFPKAKIERTIAAPCDGYITHMDSEKIGEAAVMLGAGREKKNDSIDFSAGIVLCAKTGDRVKAGDSIAVLHTSDEQRADAAKKQFLSSVRIEDKRVDIQPLIYKIVTAD